MKSGTSLAAIAALISLSLLSTSQVAQAQFAGYYAPGNFGLTNGNSTTGFLDGANAPASVTLNGPAEGGQEFRFTQINIVMPAAGTVSLDYVFVQNDDSEGDMWGYTFNSAPSDLPLGSGSFSIPVSAGDDIGFYTYRQFGTSGPASLLTLSNFSAPLAVADVPEPGNVALFVGMATCGAGFISRKRRN